MGFGFPFIVVIMVLVYHLIIYCYVGVCWVYTTLQSEPQDEKTKMSQQLHAKWLGWVNRYCNFKPFMSSILPSGWVNTLYTTLRNT